MIHATDTAPPVIPLVSKEEKQLVDILAAMYVDNLFSDNNTDNVISFFNSLHEKGNRLHSHKR